MVPATIVVTGQFSLPRGALAGRRRGMHAMVTYTYTPMYHRYLGSYVDAYILDGTSQLGCALPRLLWTLLESVCGFTHSTTKIRLQLSYW